MSISLLWSTVHSTEQSRGVASARGQVAWALGLVNVFYSHFSRFSFTVPLVSRVCPSDVCRIWKSGAKLRVDITLLGFENMSWERGRRSLIFKGEGNYFSTIGHRILWEP